MKAITKIALVLVIAILYIPLSVIAFFIYPFFDKEDR
ncbi:membrane protein [Streptococcus agalactiae]|nr:membrane protein [Streptococcus agalactiae CCUG 25532]EPT85614.1 membrane protein [Streptococcus agalactiae BSU247]EPV20932.1 membrane protein [Streptococcus agalactiae GB00640]EPX03630.1 membrane protein [Streptococcus agalactiae MRI Z1-048]KLK52895.1 membrane protein [Streptococcus agalactiae]